jgi:uncharacterized membrane protein
MPPALHALLLFLHLLAAAAWVGGMFFAHFALRPAAAEVLQPPQRLPLLAAALGRFFRLTAVSVAVILVSGFAMLLPVGFARAPVAWHLMATLGVVMAVIYGHIAHALYPRLRAAVAAGSWPQAAEVLGAIRGRVALNLALGTAAFAAAALARL